ncbi:hypothetical protein Vadar_032232 [Vaccinium darrowii]|uniref:Uncharacterized protein n=1 Tax=Vaccinium darrowii TaxID=229202 RepID=A0ACB7X5R1_9ERIC|nr:hypothetical protein Vadar_032232 [Vaccinium darrowii]
MGLLVEESKYVFEAKTIQRMELLVLSALEWKMNPVTPLLFIDHISRRLGLKLKSHFRLKFLQRIANMLCNATPKYEIYGCLVQGLCVAFRSRWQLQRCYMFIKEVEPCSALDYKNELMDALNLTLSRDKVDGLSKLIQELYGNTGCDPQAEK